jgi:stalled ribosome rescue protein Dom34
VTAVSVTVGIGVITVEFHSDTRRLIIETSAVVAEDYS